MQIEEYFLLTSDSGSNPVRPSYRRIKWWNYIEEQFKETIPRIADRLYIADQLNLREMMSEWREIDFNKEDIEKWLIIKPWVSREKMDRYLNLISLKRIPPLSEYSIGLDAFEFTVELIAKQAQYNAPDNEYDSDVLFGQVAIYLELALELAKKYGT